MIRFGASDTILNRNIIGLAICREDFHKLLRGEVKIVSCDAIGFERTDVMIIGGETEGDLMTEIKLRMAAVGHLQDQPKIPT